MENPTGMDAFVTELTTDVTSAAIWAEVAKLAPFVTTLILVSIALYFLRRVVRGAGKAKAKI